MHALFVWVALSGVQRPASAWEVRLLSRLDGVVDLYGGPRLDSVTVKTLTGFAGLRFGPDGEPHLASAPRQPHGPIDMIPHSRCAVGAADILLACLTDPTNRYDHSVLGDAVEAAALSIRRRSGGWTHHRLSGGAVFEDLTPRLVDLNGDGRDEVIVVRSDRGSGASLAVLGLDRTGLVLMYDSAPIGLSYRWLNPVGAGDFDGDGRVEVAVVRTPHIGGILMIYRPDGARLVAAARLQGFSNHRIGSTVLGQSAVLDVDGDGVDDIVLPRQDQARIVAVSFAAGRFREIAAATLPAPVATSMVKVDIDGDGRTALLFGLADGRLVTVRP